MSQLENYGFPDVRSNDPNEDDYAQAILPSPSGFWSLFALFDGHSGWETSTWLRENMIPAIVGALADTYSKCTAGTTAESPDPKPDDIQKTMKETFQRLDDDIVHSAVEQAFASESRHAAISILAPAYSGSCALLAFYDSHSRLLHTAITGDSRAVLGRRIPDADGQPSYEVMLLSAEQDGKSPAEEARLNASHPGEAVVVNGRVLGMGMSRAFGDARYKWSRDIQKRLKREYLGRTPLPHVKTPPYLTAEPEVTSVTIRPGDFLIMASDGLWESLTSEDAVGLVGWWLGQRRSRRGLSPGAELAGIPPFELPVEIENEDPTVRYGQWSAKKRFVNVDQNAATHLARNALGGADIDLMAALLSMRPPRSRVYRDDITALVVFFE